MKYKFCIIRINVTKYDFKLQGDAVKLLGYPGMELLVIDNRWRHSLLFFYRISICLYFFTIDFQSWGYPPHFPELALLVSRFTLESIITIPIF